MGRRFFPIAHGLSPLAFSLASIHVSDSTAFERGSTEEGGEFAAFKPFCIQ